ncbi:MAG TPA: hypothetical protein PK850_09890 [Ignavibacteria bacterium]|nr:hypothetical protein [Ignavibacteria bacterium]HRF66263.1 hypothetical protein [Ignavibacteria bacterium]
MKDKRTFENERSETIAQFFLKSTGIVDLLPDFGEDFDFILFPKTTHQKQIGVEVKSTKLSLMGIKKKYVDLRRKYKHARIPVLILYINIDLESGFFEIIDKDNPTELRELTLDILKREINNTFENIPTNKLWFDN